MQFTLSLTAALATLITLTTSAPAPPPIQTASVKNLCTFTVFLQSFPFDGSAAGPFTIIHPGGPIYVEAYRSTGSTIKLSRSRTLASPLFSSYTNQQTQIFYALDDQFGNPFAAFRNKIVPTNPACARFNCGPNQASCYSFAGSKVDNCPKAVNITTTLCAIE